VTALLGRVALILAAVGWLAVVSVASAEQAEKFAFRGTVTHLTIEGGFWGIIADDGQRFDPGKLPTAFQEDGRKVRVVARRTPDRLSFHQWGQQIEIVEITDDLGR